MERETQTLNQGNHIYVLKTYATAREANAIQQAYFKGTKVEVIGDKPKFSDFNPGVQFEVNQEMIRQMVVSMDDSTDNLVDRCIDLPSDEFNEVIAALDKIVSKKKS